MSTIQRIPILMLAHLKNLTLQKLISHAAVFLSLCFLLAVPTSSVFANMVLSDAIIHFEPGKPLRKDIEVENAGSETLYIQVEPIIVKTQALKMKQGK
ncbi:MAG: hypothetical protein GKR92_08415 [Gammaproteobacteria bacterium]|nr:MAG: hypothetical protein GKR92_08415 [Gammaproteobacteria bacterium]